MTAKGYDLESVSYALNRAIERKDIPRWWLTWNAHKKPKPQFHVTVDLLATRTFVFSLDEAHAFLVGLLTTYHF